jgi:cytochrome P450 family 4
VSRKLITPAFHFKILEQFVEVFNTKAGILVEKLADHVDGSEFDIWPYLSLCALDSICGKLYNKIILLLL